MHIFAQINPNVRHNHSVLACTSSQGYFQYTKVNTEYKICLILGASADKINGRGGRGAC
jgi:hypothetical protein